MFVWRNGVGRYLSHYDGGFCSTEHLDDAIIFPSRAVACSFMEDMFGKYEEDYTLKKIKKTYEIIEE